MTHFLCIQDSYSYVYVYTMCEYVRLLSYMFAFDRIDHAKANCAKYADKYMSCCYLMLSISSHGIDYYPPACEELKEKQTIVRQCALILTLDLPIPANLRPAQHFCFLMFQM